MFKVGGLRIIMYNNSGESFFGFVRLISERQKQQVFRKGENQWIMVQVATAVTLMVMTQD